MHNGTVDSSRDDDGSRDKHRVRVAHDEEARNVDLPSNQRSKCKTQKLTLAEERTAPQVEVPEALDGGRTPAIRALPGNHPFTPKNVRPERSRRADI